MFVAKKIGPGYFYSNPADQTELTPQSSNLLTQAGSYVASAPPPNSPVVSGPIATSPDELNHYAVAHQIFTAQLAAEEEQKLRSSNEDSDGPRPSSPAPPSLRNLTLSTDDVTILPLPLDPHPPPPPPPALAASPTLPSSLAMRPFASASADSVRTPSITINSPHAPIQLHQYHHHHQHGGPQVTASPPRSADGFGGNRFASWPIPQPPAAATPPTAPAPKAPAAEMPRFRLTSFGDPNTAAGGYANTDVLTPLPTSGAPALHPQLNNFTPPSLHAMSASARAAAESYSFDPLPAGSAAKPAAGPAIPAALPQAMNTSAGYRDHLGAEIPNASSPMSIHGHGRQPSPTVPLYVDDRERKFFSNSPPKDVLGSTYIPANTWNERFQNLLETPIKTPQEFQKRASLLQQMLDDFIAEAKPTVALLINELHLAHSKKTIKPIMQGFVGGLKFIHNGLFYKFATDNSNFFGGTDFASKVAGHELQAFNALMSCQVYQLHLPLISLFTYRGYRVIVSCILPINNVNTLEYGSDDGGMNIHGLPYETPSAGKDPLTMPIEITPTCSFHTKNISILLRKVCEKLNLKPHGSIERSTGKAKQMFGPTDLEVHRGLDGRYYVIDTSRLFPPERPPKHKLDRGMTTAHLYCLLRPEFVKTYPHPLSSDGFCRMGDHQNTVHNAELTEATRYLKERVIPEFCQTLLRSSMWSVDIGVMSVIYNKNKGSSLDKLKERLHSAGINCRYLGLVWENIPPSYPGLRCKILVEMMARIARKALFARFRQVIGASAETYHQVAAEFFTQLLWPAPSHGGISSTGSSSNIAQSNSSGNVTGSPIHGDFWDLTIQRGVLHYFEMRAGHELDTRSFLLGPERSQYVWLMLQRLQELTGVKIRDDAQERLRLSRFDLPTSLTSYNSATVPGSPAVARSGSLIEKIPLRGSMATRETAPVSPRSSTGSIPVPPTPSPSPSTSSANVPLPQSPAQVSTSTMAPLTRIETEHIESISILDKPVVIAPFGYQGTAESINDAEEFYLQELAQREEALGKYHPQVIKTLQNLADLYVTVANGRETQAEQYLQRIITVHRHNSNGKDTEDLAKLAKYYIRFSRFADAEPHVVESRTINERMRLLPLLAKNCMQLAQIRRQHSDFETAISHSNRAVKLLRQLYGRNHPKVAKILREQAEFFRLKRQFKVADKLAQEALQIYRATLGAEHHLVGSMLYTLARMKLSERDHNEAEQLFKQALTIQIRALGDRHPFVALTLDSLGTLCQQQGNYVLAENFFQRALSINRCQLGENHIRVAILLSKIAYLYRLEGHRRFAEAKALLERALEIKIKALGEDDLEAAHTLQDLGVLCTQMERYDEAYQHLKRALAIRMKKTGVESEPVAEVMCNLASNCALRGKTQEAFDFYAQASMINQSIRASKKLGRMLEDLKWLENATL